MDGFSDYTNLSDKWIISGESYPPVLTPGAGRFGSGAMDFTNSSNVDKALRGVPPMINCIFGFAFQWRGGGNYGICGFSSNSNVFLGLWVDAGGHLSFQPNGLQAYDYVLTANTWHYCEIKVSVGYMNPNPSLGQRGGSLECRMDGQVIMTSSNIDTEQGSGGQLDAVTIGGFVFGETNYNYAESYVSDVYVINSITQNWQANHVYGVNDMIIDSNGNIQACTQSVSPYLSGSSAPSWNTTPGQTTTDNNITWICVGPQTLSVVNDYLGPIKITTLMPIGNGGVQQGTSEISSWAANTVMAVGNTIEDSNSNIQRVSSITGNAETGATAPTWKTSVGQFTTDNNVTWECLGAFASGAFNMVNEVPPDGDMSYRQLNAASQIDLFTFATPGSSDVIKAVGEWVQARTDAAGTTSIRTEVSSGGTSGDNGSDLYLSTQYADYFADMSLDPHTQAFWTTANLILALEGASSGGFGYKRTQ
jgi:hypothetical protein